MRQRRVLEPQPHISPPDRRTWMETLLKSKVLSCRDHSNKFNSFLYFSDKDKNWQLAKKNELKWWGKGEELARSSCRGFIAQRLERPTGNRKTLVRIPAGLHCFFFRLIQLSVLSLLEKNRKEFDLMNGNYRRKVTWPASLLIRLLHSSCWNWPRVVCTDKFSEEKLWTADSEWSASGRDSSSQSSSSLLFMGVGALHCIALQGSFSLAVAALSVNDPQKCRPKNSLKRDRPCNCSRISGARPDLFVYNSCIFLRKIPLRVCLMHPRCIEN